MANVIINACDFLWWQQWWFRDFIWWIKDNSWNHFENNPYALQRLFGREKSWRLQSLLHQILLQVPGFKKLTLESLLDLTTTSSREYHYWSCFTLLFFCKLVWHCFLNFSLTTDACIQYEYSGCGGNTNTFVTEDVSGWNFYLQPRQRWWWIIWRVQPLW